MSSLTSKQCSRAALSRAACSASSTVGLASAPGFPLNAAETARRTTSPLATQGLMSRWVDRCTQRHAVRTATRAIRNSASARTVSKEAHAASSHMFARSKLFFYARSRSSRDDVSLSFRIQNSPDSLVLNVTGAASTHWLGLPMHCTRGSALSFLRSHPGSNLV